MNVKIPGRSARDIEAASETLIPLVGKNPRIGNTRRTNMNPSLESESFDSLTDNKKNKELN